MLQHKEELVLLVQDFVEVDDVGVVDLCKDIDLPVDPLSIVVLLHLSLAQYLDGYLLRSVDVDGPSYLPEVTGADLLLQLIP